MPSFSTQFAYRDGFGCERAPLARPDWGAWLFDLTTTPDPAPFAWLVMFCGTLAAAVPARRTMVRLTTSPPDIAIGRGMSLPPQEGWCEPGLEVASALGPSEGLSGNAR